MLGVRLDRWCWASAVNWLSAVLALAANAFYVFGYTMLLKRRTTQNIVWGGPAGCFPALIGWTAVTGSLAWAPVVLFVVVFFWTPPHFWALAMRYRDDYAGVDVPMLPVVAPAREVGRQIVLYTLGDGRDLAAAVAGRRHRLVYPVAAAVLGAGVPGRGAPVQPARPRTEDLAVMSRCGCSTGRTSTCRCSSWRSRSTRYCRSGV